MRSRDELMRVSRGYWSSRALLTAVEIGLFEALATTSPRTARSVARTLGTRTPATTLLLDALVGMGILRKQDDAYAVRQAMRPYLGTGLESALGMLRHHARLWGVWDQLTTAVREGRPPEPEGGFRGGPEEARAFTVAMRDGALRLAPQVAAEISFAGRDHLLDLGGGPGVYAAAFARRHPALRVTVVDLPHVCAVGREIVAEQKDVADRVTYHEADLDRDPLPRADAAFLSHVIHSQTEGEVRSLLRRVHQALVPGGMLVVRDFFTSPDRTRPPSASLFALNMLVNDTGGRSYSAREVTEMLKRIGFASATSRRSKAVLDTGYVLGRR